MGAAYCQGGDFFKDLNLKQLLLDQKRIIKQSVIDVSALNTPHIIVYIFMPITLNIYCLNIASIIVVYILRIYPKVQGIYIYICIIANNNPLISI